MFQSQKAWFTANTTKSPPPGQVGQQWTWSDRGDGYHTILNRGSGKALDVANRSTADGAHCCSGLATGEAPTSSGCCSNCPDESRRSIRLICPNGRNVLAHG